MATPTDSPLSDAPSSANPDQPPSLVLVDAIEDQRATHQALYNALVGELTQAAAAYEAIAGSLQGAAQASLQQALMDYRLCADRLSGHVLAVLGLAANEAAQVGVEMPSPEQIQDIAMSLPPVAGPMPPMPGPRPPFYGGVVPGVVDSGSTGGTYGITQNPPLPDYLGYWGLPPAPPGYQYVESTGPTVTTTGEVIPGAPPVLVPITDLAASAPAPASGPLPPISASGYPSAPPGPTQPTIPTAIAGTIPAAPAPPAAPGGGQSPFPPSLPTGAVQTAPIVVQGVGGSTSFVCPTPYINVPSTPAIVNVQPSVIPAPVVQLSITVPPAGPVQVQLSGPEVTVGGDTVEVSPGVESSPGQPAVVAPPDTQFVPAEPTVQVTSPIEEVFGATPAPSAAPTTFDDLERALAKIWDLMLDPVSAAGCKIPKELEDNPLNAIRWLWRWLTGYDDGYRWTDNSAVGRMLAVVPPVIRPLGVSLATLVLGWLNFNRQNQNLLLGCKRPEQFFIVAVRSFIGIVERWIGAPMTEGRQHIDQAAGMLCAAAIPTTGEAHTAYLANAINEDTWRCWVRANGDRDDLAAEIRRSLEARPSPFQMVEWGLKSGLSRDGIIKNLRDVGVTKEWTADQWLKLAEYVPGPSDLVSFMTRDVFDEEVARLYGYDDEFKEKFTGKVLDWARSQGMQADQFRFFWRAHWHLPSPGQGYDMLHRLRPGRVPQQVETTRDDVSRLLAINDWPTYWRDRLIALSYHPLTRVDTRRAYFSGSLSREDTFEAILDLGYAPREAQHLMNFWTLERLEWVANRPWARAYARGELSDAELEERTTALNLSPKEQDQVRAELQSRLLTTSRKRSIAAIRRRVTRGITPWTEAVSELRRRGYEGTTASLLAQSWDEERQARGKYPSAAELCKWHDRGLISTQEYADALVRQGYSPDDIVRIMETCSVDWAEKHAKKGKQEQAAQQREEKQVQSAAQTAARRRNAATARAVREAKKATRDEATTQRRLAKTANLIAAFEGDDAGDWHTTVQRLFGRIVGEKRFERPSAANLLLEVIGAQLRQGRDDWEAEAEAFIDRLPEQPKLPVLPDPISAEEELQQLAGQLPPTFEGNGQK